MMQRPQRPKSSIAALIDLNMVVILQIRKAFIN
jgi:hypothetical protein